jgi:hypothetical protein
VLRKENAIVRKKVRTAQPSAAPFAGWLASAAADRKLHPERQPVDDPIA